MFLEGGTGDLKTGLPSNLEAKKESGHKTIFVLDLKERERGG